MRTYYKLTSQEEEPQDKFSSDTKPKLNGEHLAVNGSTSSEVNANFNRSMDFKELLASYPWIGSKRSVSQERLMTYISLFFIQLCVIYNTCIIFSVKIC
jgi:hypothetical protein